MTIRENIFVGQKISADALKKEVANMKKCFKSENHDYATGYISALSVVEGLIAYLCEPLNNYFEDKTESGLLEE